MKLAMAAVFVVVVGLFAFAPPAPAYQVDLTIWNTAEIQGSGDHVTVDITGSTITFTFLSGGGLTNTFQAMQNIAFQPDVFGIGNTITGASSPYTLSCGTASGGGSCNEDGFLVNPAAAEYSTPNAGPGNPSTATFTFATALPSGLDATDFDVHVSYSGSCSGWVDGTLKGTAGSNDNCTPVPEPMTMLLGGTGLASLAFAGRKRLFGRGGLRRDVAI